ncbi:MAG: RNA-directed DNA polymerase, partial [Candidatus Sungbacteria bacterium]|nr:RNA-directed DNA polymerase [Candidatus Sungbacteria bacterium]
MRVLEEYIFDRDILWLLGNVVGSFSSSRPGVGLPLGNLTSQLLVNVYMNGFDHYIKHGLKARCYIRYADDFVVISESRDWLERQIPRIGTFLEGKLGLELHPQKVFIKTLASGVDFLGWVHFPEHRVLRTTTKKRMVKKIEENKSPETIASYLGLLRHGNAYKIREEALNRYRSSVTLQRCF